MNFLRDTIKKYLYLWKGEINIQDYVVGDFVGDVEQQRSTIYYIFIFDNGGC